MWAASPRSWPRRRRTISARPSYPLTSPSISICFPLSCRTSPTCFRSPGNTTTVKGQTRKSSQKSKKCTPPLPSFTCKTFPVMQRLAPMCFWASEKGMHGRWTKARKDQREQNENPREKTHAKGGTTILGGLTAKQTSKQGDLRPLFPGWEALKARRPTRVDLSSPEIVSRTHPSGTWVGRLYEKLAEGLYGRGLVVLHVEDGIELRNLKQVVDLLGEVEQLQLAALVFDGGVGADQLANARAVDIIHVA